MNKLFSIITSTSDLQPSTVISNQLPDQSASTQTGTMGGKIVLNSALHDSVQCRDCNYS